jgi:hypothetical protein
VNDTASLFDDVVEATGLMALIAPYTVSRLLISAGYAPRELTRDDLARALADLERGLAVYLDAEQLDRSMAKLRRLAAG